MDSELKSFIEGLPKVELHLHIEGSLEPELMFKIAERNNLALEYDSVESLKKAYKFNNLQEFLDIYYKGAQVLIHEIDFFDLTWAYLEKVHTQNVHHVEVFFDPQTHTERGIHFNTVIKGIYEALKKGERDLGISFKLIMCFLRHLSEEDAFKTLEQAKEYKSLIYGIGLDSSELGNPPSKFKNVFKEASNQGYVCVAHAGEEGPAEYVWDALNTLNIARIDHGNRSLDDLSLTQHLIKEQIGLTICPLSNLELCVVTELKNHPLKNMLDKGLLATINSDDPAYFGGYMNENYLAISKALELNKMDIIQLAKNGINASFLDYDEKQKLHKILTDYIKLSTV